MQNVGLRCLHSLDPLRMQKIVPNEPSLPETPFWYQQDLGPGSLGVLTVRYVGVCRFATAHDDLLVLSTFFSLDPGSTFLASTVQSGFLFHFFPEWIRRSSSFWMWMHIGLSRMLGCVFIFFNHVRILNPFSFGFEINRILRTRSSSIHRSSKEVTVMAQYVGLPRIGLTTTRRLETSKLLLMFSINTLEIPTRETAEGFCRRFYAGTGFASFCFDGRISAPVVHPFLVMAVSLPVPFVLGTFLFYSRAPVFIFFPFPVHACAYSVRVLC